MNCRINDYYLSCSDESFDIYAFTETWLNCNTTSQQIFGPSYAVFRQDRNAVNSSKKHGGGVLLAVHSSIAAREITPPNSAVIEQIWVALSLIERTVFICIIYIPPDRTNDANYLDKHADSLSWVVSHMKLNDQLIVLGDFNLSGIKWIKSSSDYMYPDVSESLINSTVSSLIDVYNTAQICQINGVLNVNRRILDLCFVSSEFINCCTVAEAPVPLVKTCKHHPPLYITIARRTQLKYKETCELLTYNYSRADYSSFNQFIDGVDWDNIFYHKNINEVCQVLTNIITYAIDQFVPKQTHKPIVHPPWMNDRLRSLKKRKRSAFKKFTKHRTALAKSQYLLANKRYKKLNKKLFLAHQRRIQFNLKCKPKSFWKYVNEQRKESGLPASMTMADKTADTIEAICDLFREQFSNIFVSEILSDAQVQKAAMNVPRVLSLNQHPEISPEIVKNACAELKSSSNAGPDGIPSIVLKKCSCSLAVPLARLYNLSLGSGAYPESWKQSFVYPVFKKGNKANCNNYRGIASLCSISQLFEKITLKFLTHNCRHYIANEQHGFVPKRSTTTNLMLFTSDIVRAMQQRLQVDAIYTDFSAAFDKINHQIMIAKFERLGISGPLLSWLHSYLTNRKMAVKIGDSYSSFFNVSSGVPQGSHLGPFIFLLYLNDINLSLKCLKSSYADDFKLYHVIRTTEDQKFLQEQLDVFTSWCTTNRMVLNPSKCSVISFSRKRSLISYEYKMFGLTLQRVNVVKDLGVLLDQKLTFNEHIAYISAKANRALGFMFRVTKHFRNIHCLKSVYCCLVRSHLEYACLIWSPFYQNGIQKIEAIQRKFLRFASRLLPWNDPNNLPPYENRCALLGLDLLSLRRNIAKALFASDLLRSDIDCPRLLERLNLNIRVRNLRRNNFFFLPGSRTNYGHNEPILNICRVFNQCSPVFDFHLSRTTLRKNFRVILS